jgi:hypothetical protein
MVLKLNGLIAGFGLMVAIAAPAWSADKLKDPPPTSSTPVTAPPTERVVGPLSPADAAALATMNDRLKEYIDLHNKIKGTLPALPKNSTPEQIDKRQRQFENLMRQARATAKQGDLFTPEARPVIKRLLANVFSGPDGRQLKAAIFDFDDKNPGKIALTVNGRYPDTVPLSNVPPQVLQTLPKLTADLEYRFIGDNLILLDTDAHIVADFIEDTIPR